MTEEIIHDFPDKKVKPRKPNRIKKTEFESIKTSNFLKWFSGINPLTNRKIEIGGRTYDNVAKELGFTYNYETYKQMLKMSESEIKSYNKKTIRYFAKWVDECQRINKYNKEVDNINKEMIDNLSKWEDFVVFKNKKYGLPEIYNRVHMKDNCSGEIIKGEYEICTCNKCESWGGNGCCHSRGTQYYKCLNCKQRFRDLEF